MQFLLSSVASAWHCSPNIYALNLNHANEIVTFFESGDTKVDGFQTDDGDIILRQYVNDVLVQQDTIESENPDIIKRKFFTADTRSNQVTEDTIRISDYITITQEPSPSITPFAKTYLGTVYFQALVGDSFLDYGLKCSYDSTFKGTTTYTINEYLGPVIDLVGILVGALNMPFTIVSVFVTALLKGLGIAVVSGAIKQAVSDTVSAQQTDYDWTLVDIDDPKHSKNITASKYVVSDYKSVLNGETYYEGCGPAQWGAIWLHTEMFPYDSWEVIDWS